MELKNVQIISIGELQQITPTFKKVSFRVKTDDKYPQEVEFDVKQDKADSFLQYNKVGNFVDIDFNLQGRSSLKAGDPETARRWWNTLDAWKIFKAESPANAVVSQAPFETVDSFSEQPHDDMPF
jgi:hypothetical protein